jgi:hypothetical protein
MADSRTGPDRPADEIGARRWWPAPRTDARIYARQMVLAVVIAALGTACFVVLALLLDSFARSWEVRVVFGVGVLTVGFYCWAIYSTVRSRAGGRSPGR